MGGVQGQSGIDTQHYIPPGPVAQRFIKSTGPIDVIMGPAGSGKTVACCARAPYMLSNWFPVCTDGIVRAKIAVIRNTYRDLARTCLGSWLEMFPEKHPWTVSYQGGLDRPVTHKLAWRAQRGATPIKIELDVEFGAIGDANIENFIKGYQITAGWMNECDLLDGRVPSLFWQRTGRYPPVQSLNAQELDRVVKPFRKRMQDLGLNIDDDETLLPRVVWGDMNPPDIDNWSYDVMVENPNPLFTLHKQPSGLAPNAENRIGKPRSSYELEARTMKPYDVKRYVHGEFGYALDGEPIYPGFSLDLHRADQTLAPVANLPLLLGVDTGGSPAIVFAQAMPNGQLRVLQEICCQPGSGPVTIGRLGREALLSRYAGLPIGGGWVDPSAFYGADKVSGQLHAAAIISEWLGINLEPGPSQEPGFRWDAVRWYLEGLIDGLTPRMIVDPSCKLLIGGFVAHYKLTKQASAGATNLLVAVKNKYSHPHDALQYLITGYAGRAGVTQKLTRDHRMSGNVTPLRPVIANTSFDVFSV